MQYCHFVYTLVSLIGPRDPYRLLKCCTQYASKYGKLSSGHRTGKGQFSFQSQRKAMPKNVQPMHNCTHFTSQHSNAQNSPSQASIVREPRTSRCSSWIQKRQRNERSNCQHPLDHRKSKRVPENIYFCFIDCTKAFVDHNKLWKILKEMGIPDHLPPEKSVCRSRSNSQNQTWNNRLVPNWERSTSRLQIVTLLI